MRITKITRSVYMFLLICLITSCRITDNSESLTPLFVAAKNGNIALADKLIKNCDAINQIRIGTQTPLHVAAASGQDEMVVWLLAREADPVAKDQNGKTPYDFAVEHGQVNSATIISNYIQTRKDEDDIYRLGRFNLLDTLLYVDDYRQLNLLHYFAEVGDVNNLTSQIQKVKDINVTTKAGKTPLHYAVIAEQLNSIELLLNAGANPNIGDMYNKTSLYYAVENSNIRIIKLLLNFGANPLISSYCNNMNSLELAKSMNNQEVISLLQGKK